MAKESKNKLAVIKQSDLEKTESLLKIEQLNFLLQRTPEHQIKTRPAKGGGTWKYVTGAYMKKVLNLMFGFDWDFEIKKYDFDIKLKQAFVLGRLTITLTDKFGNTRHIIKEQFGRVEIKFKTDWVWDDAKQKNVKVPTDEPLDLGNDLKAAATDALKKCASELGIAQDIYAENEYKEIFVVSDEPEDVLNEIIEFMKSAKYSNVPEDDKLYFERIVDEKEVGSYNKLIAYIKKMK